MTKTNNFDLSVYLHRKTDKSSKSRFIEIFTIYLSDRLRVFMTYLSERLYYLSMKRYLNKKICQKTNPLDLQFMSLAK